MQELHDRFCAQSPLEQSHLKVIRTDCRQGRCFSASLGIAHELVPFVSMGGKPQAVLALGGNRPGHFHCISVDMNKTRVRKYLVNKRKPETIDWQLFYKQWPIGEDGFKAKEAAELITFLLVGIFGGKGQLSLPLRRAGCPDVGFRI